MWRPKLGIPLAAIVLGVLWMTIGTSGQTTSSQVRLKTDTTPSTKNGEWPHYTADLRGTKYSPLDQINASNFKDLEVVWRFKTDSLGTRPEYKLEGTPLMIGGVLYTTGGTRRSVVALDARTGELLWVHRYPEGTRGANAPRQLSGRGVAYWTDGRGDDRVLYVTPGYRLIALNAKTGVPIPSFGKSGVVDMKVGAKKDGRLTAVAARVVQDGGVYCSYGVVTIFYSGALLGALYDIPNIRYDGYRVLTNKPACGAMRGHGTVNVRFAFESSLDEIAARLGIDPAEIRRRNLLKPPCITVNNLRVQSYGLPECIDKVVERSGWKQRKGRLALKRGLGIGCSHYVSGAANSIIRSDMPHSTVNIKIDRDGGVVVYTGASDIGQGSDTMVAQVVAEVLGIGLARIKVVAADTDLTPIDIGSYSSRVTFMNGNASLRAAQDVKKKIVAAAAAKMNCAPEDVIMRDDRVWKRGVAEPKEVGTSAEKILDKVDSPRGSVQEVSGRVEGQTLRGSLQQKRKEEGPKDHMSFEEAVVSAIDFSGALTGTGSYAPPKDARGGNFKGAGVGPSPAYSYSAQVAEVSVDTDTGEVTVHKIWAAHDCGRALNPVSVEGQVIGSVWMGLGQALQEEMVWKDGLLMNPGMLEYKSPSAVESPDVECIIVESVDPEGPFGAKEASEGSLAATIPAIANAIYDAVGIRLREAPFTPERVLAALKQKKLEAKALEITRGADPSAPKSFREHGGSLWYKGKGPVRHEQDPARRPPIHEDV